MRDAREPSVTAEPVGDGYFPHSLGAEPFGEPLDPNEIRIALDELRDFMSRIRSAAISRHLRTAYERIGGIMVRERVPSPADQDGQMPRGR